MLPEKKKDRLTQFLRLALKYAPWKLVSNFWPWAFEGFCWYARILKNPYLWSNFANKQTWRLSFQTYFLQENINSLYSLVSHCYFLLKTSDSTNLSALFMFIMIKNVAIVFLPDQHASGDENRETTSSNYSRWALWDIFSHPYISSPHFGLQYLPTQELIRLLLIHGHTVHGSQKEAWV